jgi:hypothetical protein
VNDNPCLRPASLSQVKAAMGRPETISMMVSRWLPGGRLYESPQTTYLFADLERLYDAEWRLRGFEGSP